MRFIVLPWWLAIFAWIMVAGVVAAILTIAVTAIILSVAAGVLLFATGRVLAGLGWQPTWSDGLIGAGLALMVTIPRSTVQLLARR
jgi:hypothetical protein